MTASSSSNDSKIVKNYNDFYKKADKNPVEHDYNGDINFF